MRTAAEEQSDIETGAGRGSAAGMQEMKQARLQACSPIGAGGVGFLGVSGFSKNPKPLKKKSFNMHPLSVGRLPLAARHCVPNHPCSHQAVVAQACLIAAQRRRTSLTRVLRVLETLIKTPKP